MARDAIDTLLEQHTRIRELLDAVQKETGEERQARFDELRALLAVHETAEEEVVRPVTRNSIEDGAAVVDELVEEENKGTELLARLEEMGVDHPEFATTFTTFKEDVLEHAGHEETKEFPRLREQRTVNQLDKLGAAFEAAEAVAPTHPHPSATSTTRNLVLGPFAAVTDRVRDAIKAVTS